MIVYSATIEKFRNDVDSNYIDKIIKDNLLKRMNISVGESEYRAWGNSLMYMDKLLSDNDIPRNCGVAIEYNIPQSSKRIDFILSGYGNSNELYTMIIELKQWQDAQKTEKDGIVMTRFKHGISETTHPSYQAWSYAKLLEGYNEFVYKNNVKLRPCAYLHNFENSNQILTHSFYSHYLSEAPIFMKSDVNKLRLYIKSFLAKGDNCDIIEKIDSSKIRPSKALADSIASMLRANREFIMIDEQKIVYEEARILAKNSSSKNKNVLIIEGGPGTGKSVVAINLLANLTTEGLNTMYVSKNAAPRNVYEKKLTGTFKKTEISNLFKGSGSFIQTQKDSFDALIVDEAHRLNEKSGLYGVDGENQIKEIINSSKLSVFFLDEDQKVTIKDIGEKSEILKWAKKAGASVKTLELTSQFRCNGSNGYIAWLDHILQIRKTANLKMSELNYDFKVFSSPSTLKEEIIKKNDINGKSRLVAGYCWDWISKKNKSLYDIEIKEHNFRMQWNLDTDGSLWIISPESINQIGCIHTCQGLELDYVGVIIGPDFIIRGNRVITDATKRSKNDSSVKGAKSILKNDLENSKILFDRIIKNTYRTLMTRGMKGCYIYCTDQETNEYFKNSIK
jgi:hypothetical protein